MAAKINNEIKIGILVIVAIVALIFGVRLLQGKGLFDSGKDLLVYYDDAGGLQQSSPVFLKGVQIGRVKDIELTPEQKIKVTLHIIKGYEVPKGTSAQMESTSMIASDKAIFLHFPEQINGYHEDGETLISVTKKGLIENLTGELSPVMDNVNGTITNIDSIARNVNNIVNPATQQHLNNTFANLDVTMAQLSKLVAELNNQTRHLNGIMRNIDGVTGNLNNNNEKITNILDNTEKATQSLTGPEIKQTLASIESAAKNLNETIQSINSSDGTLGLLTRDRALYDNLNKVSQSLDELMIDLKKHPGRYINVSVFGSSNRGN